MPTLNLVKSIEGKFGEGLSVGSNEDLLKGLTTEDDLYEEVYEYVVDDEELDVSYEVLYDERKEDYESVEQHVWAWFTRNVVFLNKEMGQVIIANYSVNYEDSYNLIGVEDYEGDIRLYPYTEELQQHLETFNSEKKVILEEKRKEYEKNAAESRKRSEELAQARKEVNAEIKEVREGLANILTAQGFKQLRSAKGNLISQYELIYYTYEGEMYATFGDMVKVIESQGTSIANILGEVRNLTERTVRISVQQKGRLEVVKKYTTKSILYNVQGYVNILNKKKGYQQQYVSVLPTTWDMYENKDVVLTDYIKEREETERQRAKEQAKSFENLLAMFR